MNPEPLDTAIRDARHRLGSLAMALDLVLRLPRTPDTLRLLGEALAKTEALLQELRQRVAREDVNGNRR